MKYYCITLAETPERTEHARAQAAKAGIELDFIQGIFGKTMQVKTVGDTMQFCLNNATVESVDVDSVIAGLK